MNQVPVNTIEITPKAAEKVKSFAERDGLESFALKVAVKGGGCSGLTYDLEIIDSPIDDEMSYGGSKQAAIKMLIKKYKTQAKIRLLREGFISENNLDLNISIRNDKRNTVRALRKMELLPLK